MKTLVFTNGVFDLLHSGHVRLLEFARSLGDRLVVGINSDESARRLKGPTRPIMPAASRKSVLESIRYVDAVKVFETDTPEQLIESLSPDVLVKGPEASGATIPGASFVLSRGGQVAIPDWPTEESTTMIVRATIETPAPLPRCCIARIENRPADFESLSIRFTKAPDGVRPVLYASGRRVIDPWSIRLSHDQPKDKNGTSA
jgi:rfaE bifunctional protein nucleotidyltransferase chain/domain